MHISTHLEERNTVVCFIVSLSLLNMKVSAVNIFLKTVFYQKQTSSLLFLRFTTDHDTPLLELSTGFPVLFLDLP